MINKIILASQSPRRRELLEQVGIEFEVIPSAAEEKAEKSDPVEIVIELSSQKAIDVGNANRSGVEDNTLIIGADTVVALDGEVMGKPKDREQAIAMLKKLQGRTHCVYTGVCLHYKTDGGFETVSFAKETKVTFYQMTDQEIERYVDTGEPMDKAGAYGIQGRSAVFIKEIAGDYNNVVGLPVAEIYQQLNERGWTS